MSSSRAQWTRGLDFGGLLFGVMVLSSLSAWHCAGGPDTDQAPGIYVQEIWQDTRNVSGHHVHVVTHAVPCASCHELEPNALGEVHPARCGACHEQEVRIEHAEAQARERFDQSARADCTLCHAFRLQEGEAARDAGATAHPLTPFAPSDCARCHLDAQGELPAVRVHSTALCVSCHRPHESTEPEPAPCVGCHTDITTRHAAEGRDKTQVCTTCHQHQHAAATDARQTCSECHAETEPIVPASALFQGGHQECIGCHRPHDFGKSEAVSCESCHEGLHVLGGPRVREHNRCTSCHDAHAVQATGGARSPEKACAGCHDTVHPDHPQKGVAGTCIGCHDPHPGRAELHSKVRNCTSCHQVAHTETAFHGGTQCRKCHAPHDFVIGDKGKKWCAECHADPVRFASQLAGHQTCESCHRGLPHRPTALQAGCDTCHQSVFASIEPGHRACTSCHEPHGGSLTQACEDCHRDQHRTAPTGHQTCTQCHQPHTGLADQRTCSSCHRAEAETPHGAVKTGCETCHRAHGPEPSRAPSCETCHAKAALKGLHSVQKHQTCSQCHAGHGPTPSAARDACLSCHVDKRNHFPDASRCANCHLFGPTR